MDHDKDQNDNAGNSSSNFQIRNEDDQNDDAGNSSSNPPMRNEETGEVVQGAYFQYRTRAELFASDDETDESVGNSSSDKISHNATTFNTDFTINNPGFSEYLDSIDSYNDFNENISCLFDSNRQNPQQENEDLTTKLNEIFLNDDSSKCAISSENNSEILGLSPEKVNASDNNSYQENKRSPTQASGSFYPEPFDHFPQNLESSAETEENISMSPQACTSDQSNFSSNFVNALLPDCMPFSSLDPGAYSMIPSPISSRYIKLKNPLPSQDQQNPNASHRPDPHTSESNLSSTLLDRLRNSPSTSFEDPVDIVRRKFSQSLEHPNTSSRNIPCKEECQKLDAVTLYIKSVLNPDYERRSPNSHVRDLSGKEKYNDIFNTEEHQRTNACTSTNNKFSRKSSSSLSDLPSTSKISPQRTPPCFSEYPTLAPKSARKLNFDSDTSSDDSKEKNSTLTGSSVRKLRETNEPRKKRKTAHLPESSENQSTLPEIGNDRVSENTHSVRQSPIIFSVHSDEKSSKANESESVSSILSSSETTNSEIFETSQSSRKRLISDTKASDSDEGDVKIKTNKKLKQDDSSYKEIN